MLKFSSGGQVVIMLTFYSDNSSSIPAEVYSSYSVILFEKNVNKNKRGRDGPFLASASGLPDYCVIGIDVAC